MILGQVGQNMTRIFLTQAQAIQPDHPFDRLLPTFWGCADPGNSSQIPLTVGLVTAAASIDCDLVRDPNAWLRLGRHLIRRRCRRPLCSLRLRRHSKRSC